MGRSNRDDSESPRRSRRDPVHYWPVIWIAVLLACWFVIAEWNVLPDLITHTMAALP